MPRIILGTLAAAAVAASLTACGSTTNAGRTSAGGDLSSAPSAPAAGTPSPEGPTSGGPTQGAPSAGAPTTGSPTNGTPGASQGGAGTGPATNPRALRCTTPMLKASLTDYDAGAGQRYLTLVLTNTSSRSCTTGGWSGLAQAGANGAIRTQVVREGTAHTITLSPGGSAYEKLHWTVVPADDETGATCQPVPSSLRVIPPNEATRLTAPWSYGPVCQHGRISLTPLSLTP
ncbi:DUF4232 domain-containing protein [Actinomadura macra]|uniref:DUF4232 domain-containing protein n=1 Tax=Actinomadura macra TaxID=46164 RepID=UPI00082D51C3|nr:DUF4232 domain-containing protein [Actinomadura macra]